MSHQPDDGPLSERWVRLRLRCVLIAAATFYGAVGLRLVQLQVFPDPTLKALADRQFRMITRTAPYRRPILDRNLEELAVSIPSLSLYARPKLIRGRLFTARILASTLGGTAEKWLAKMKADRPFVWLQRQLSLEAAENVLRRKQPGIFSESENRRVYPNGPVGSAVLGFVDVDGRGLAGLELSMDSALLEKSSSVPMGRDGRGTPSYIDRRYASERVAREAVVTTIDRRLQNAVEEELEQSVGQTQAEAAIAIVLDPHSGEILALAQRPGFDPNEPAASGAARWSNRAVSHLYEPGSVAKPLFAAEAIERGLLTPDSLVDCGGGTITVATETFREASASHRFGILPLDKALAVSSNVAAVRVAQLLGIDGMMSAMERFGLASRTGVELPAETSGPPRDKKFFQNQVQLATTGFGQGIQTTPLQIATAFAVLANGGYAVKPTVLRKAGLDLPQDPARKRVLSEKTARVMRKMLRMVTEADFGTGKTAALAGVTVAGKTGTAQKYEAGKGYASKKYFSSFVGMVPADKPELVVAVMIDEPKKAYYAAEVAAPVFKRISERSLAVLGRTPKLSVARSLVAGPREPSTFVLREGSADLVPDLAGLPLREALRSLGGAFPDVRIKGSGFVVAQRPSAGTERPKSGRIEIELAPQ